MLLFIVILVIYKYRNRWKLMLDVRLAGPPVWELLFTWLPSVISFMLSFSHEMSWMRSGT